MRGNNETSPPKAISASGRGRCITAAPVAFCTGAGLPRPPDHDGGAVPAWRSDGCDCAHYAGQHVAIARAADHHRKHRRRRRHDRRRSPSPRRAARDGYTVLLHQVAMAAGMTLYSNLTFDIEKDFVTIGLINTAASTLAARPTLPPNTIGELVRWINEPGRNAKVAHPGVGSFG